MPTASDADSRGGAGRTCPVPSEPSVRLPRCTPPCDRSARTVARVIAPGAELRLRVSPTGRAGVVNRCVDAAGAGSTVGAAAAWLAESAGVALRVAAAVDDLRGVRVRAGVGRSQHRGGARGGLRLPRDRREPRARPPAASGRPGCSPTTRRLFIVDSPIDFPTARRARRSEQACTWRRWEPSSCSLAAGLFRTRDVN